MMYIAQLKKMIIINILDIKKYTDESIKDFTYEKLELLNTYMCDSGDITLKSLKLLREKSPDTIVDIFEYICKK